MIITIDGKSGTGKSTVAKTVAKILGYLCVSTGDIYREIAYVLNKDNLGFFCNRTLDSLLNYKIENNFLKLNYPGIPDTLNSEFYGQLAANLAKSKDVKRVINESIVHAIRDNNAVVEGRNVSTSLYPNAEIKILLTANIDVCAKRRHQQLNGSLSIDEILDSLEYRDKTVEIRGESYSEIIDTSLYSIEDTISKIIRLVHQKTHQTSLIELKHFLHASYSRDTAYKKSVESWNQDKPETGHCAITAMIVNKYFGGEIQFGYSEKYNIWHYWNIINDKVVDFTLNQFEDTSIEFVNTQTTTFDELYSIESVKYRYLLLKMRMEAIQNKFWELNDQILHCHCCTNVHSPAFFTVSFGSDCRILIVGEAPAKNGWRITGKAWINEKGELVPTAKILQKLLNEIGFELSDVTYIEAIKCYPEDGHVTKEQKNNCKKFCLSQIGLLKPLIVLSMGKHATEYLLGNDIKFSDVVGKKVVISTEYGNSIVIPIYHTSPVSPASYKKNVEIFEYISSILNKYK